MAMISYYTVCDTGPDGQPDQRYPLSYDQYPTREDAQKYIDARLFAIRQADVHPVIVEHSYEARFHVMAPSAPTNALGFSAVVREDYDGWRVLSVPAEHSKWQALQLLSGLWLADDGVIGYEGYETLEAARLCAQHQAIVSGYQREED